MTTTFRKTLMATTVLAGFAIFGLDAAQAGPNGPSNIGGSISGFSSMRMDFNRVGGPSRLLARDEMRIIPLDVTKNADKGAAKKNAAKKGTDVARVSNPKSVTGGKGKEDRTAGRSQSARPGARRRHRHAVGIRGRRRAEGRRGVGPQFPRRLGRLFQHAGWWC